MKKANLKCPHCKHTQEVEIPENKCLAFAKCKKCEKLITPPDKKCCVICAYSDKKCPIGSENDSSNNSTTEKTKEVNNTENKNKPKKLKAFKVVLLFFVIWFLIATSGIVYFSFFDSNLYQYIKKTKTEDSSANILKKYQTILDTLSKLNEKEISNPEVKEEVKKLTKEIHELRTLNPYYQFKAIKANAVPSGIPEGYGSELSVSFDKVQESIDILAEFGPTYGDKKIELEGKAKERYIKIGMSISCEYCCDVDAIVKEDGEAACGCAHSQAMRGLAAYLLQNHPDKYSDEKILDELAKWKATYFPKQTIQKVLAEKKEAGEEGIEELLNEFPEFLPDMVGGC